MASDKLESREDLGGTDRKLARASKLIAQAKADLAHINAIVRDSDGEVLARIATPLLARDLSRVIANVDTGTEIQLKQAARIIRSGAASTFASGYTATPRHIVS